MNAEWNDFLKGAGAVFEHGQTSHFGQPERELRAALEETICCDLSHLGLIAARGPEAEPFLQGQLTCDVRQVTPDLSLLGAYCSPKGRALACIRLFQRGDDRYLELPRGLVEPTLNRLRKYVLRARIALEDASDTLARIGVAGSNAATLLTNLLGAVPEAANAVIRATMSDGQDVTLIRLPGPAIRFELHGPASALAAIWTALAPEVAFGGSEPWRLLDILAGTPAVHPETVEAFVPQMLNLQRLDGISFQKGCYTGQEVVARTHYLGKLKRRMYLARVDTAAPPRPGDPLFSPQADASQSAGRLADACRHPGGGYAVLAVALIECAEHGALQLGDASGPKLRLEPLPYDFEAAA
ncbi:MAG: folate-binding protein [Candidatus Competibacter sp.]|nr:folate-binding protein [Candidatus Competibacter sp.]